MPLLPSLPLAAADYTSPLLWAVVIGWIISVILHEFAHGLVAHLGGDYTIRERGGLSLNPLQYLDPVFSVLLPLVFLLMGGIPLPGGVTSVRTDLLRNRYWCSAVSLAGPAANLLILLALLLLMRPEFGIVDLSLPTADWSTLQTFIAASAFLQAFSIVLNLIPLPPLDGFNALAPFLPPAWADRARTPPVPLLSMVFIFMVVGRVPLFYEAAIAVLRTGLALVGLDPYTLVNIAESYNHALRG